MAALQDFKAGDRVILSRVVRPAFKGKTGVVLKTVKRRNVVRIQVEGTIHDIEWGHVSAGTYDAEPQNIDKAGA